ncbi:MAG: DEAD/DEAH box helicase [Candidatus Aenigmarchaeota archaeon]|nr:DEAD/DEAH box helicase [Candidatus Aenigmarchaeota archaeon]
MTFSTLNLPAPIVTAVSEMGYTAPTAIQEKAIPLILSGKDILGHSETGSGKTAAFGLPLLANITPGQGIRVLILTPTRELCMQVSDSLRNFGKYLKLSVIPVYGGVGIGAQLNSARRADIIVATPGRLLDLISRGVTLSTVKSVVLDEADRMLDMGFIQDVEKILGRTPKQRQTLLFSATLSPKLHNLVHRYMNSPVSVQAKTHVDTNLLTEQAYAVQTQDKFSLLIHFLKHEASEITLVFCATRRGCDKLAKKLRAQKIDATPIHGGLSQSTRIRTIETLHKQGTGILVATDVASRGLHINNISHVYNYDLPRTPDDYVHRIGRTARAGAKGNAITFVTPQDSRDFNLISRNIGRHITYTQPPEFVKVTPDANPTQPFKQHTHNKTNYPFWKHRRR